MALRGTARFIITALIAGALCGAPAVAQAATLYVDDSGSNVSNNCQTPATPCLTIGQATSQPGTGNVIHLGGGDYAETVTLDNGESLVEDQAFAPAALGEAEIDNSPTAAPAVTISSAGSLLQGVSVVSGFTAVTLTAAGTVSGNTFGFDTAPTGPFEADLNIAATAGSPTVTGNTFSDTDSSDEQVGIVSQTTGAPTIANNRFSGFFDAVFAYSLGGATPVISGNEIVGTHNTTFQASGIIILTGAQATITGNFIHSPGAGASDAIAISQNTSGPPNTGATLQRNRVFGHQTGVRVAGALGPVTLDSDLIAKSLGTGISMFELGGNGGGDVTATNVTVIDTAAASPDINLGAGAQLTLDSSIVGTTPGVNDPAGGTCVISFSRGSGTNDCSAGFTTVADPMFVNPAMNDYHLIAGSPMIDTGNPAAPAPGSVDLDGDPRAFPIPATCGVTPPAPRRDIGADEFTNYVVPAIGCPAPVKKCKKGQKLKKGKCVKKKRKKKKKKKG